jgi:hypothetical protein
MEEGGQLMDLGLADFSGDNVSEAYGMTESGQVVGRSGVGANRRGMVWTLPADRRRGADPEAGPVSRTA